uniref:Uncharacterized protein n=1 Tax=Setaria viridis TaxID=4556 RepID=A0A4U6W1J2_SETVI|nr:hypothetical protein SEVIR_2G431100v2 [Setaria viridis]
MRQSRHAALAWLIDGDLVERGNIAHHSDSDKRNESVTWSTMASVARSPHVVFLRGDETEVESNGGCGEAPASCLIAVATARQPARGPDSVVSLCQVERDVAAALQQRVPHGGGLLGVVQLFLLVPCRRRVALGGFGEL